MVLSQRYVYIYIYPIMELQIDPIETRLNAR